MTDDGHDRRSPGDSVDRDMGELLRSAEHAIREGRAESAVTTLQKAVELDPGAAAAWSELGRALNNLGQLSEARRVLQRAVELEPESAVAWNRLGHVCRRLDDLEAAQAAFRQAMEQDPAFLDAAVNLATVLLAGGDPAAGVDMLRQAIAANPSVPGPRAQLGDALQGLGQPEEAETAYRGALDLDPENGAALAGLGALASARGQYDSAEALLRRALDVRPGDPVALASLIHILELRGQGEEVLGLLDRAPWAEPPGWATVAAARQLFRLGRAEAATERLERLDDQLLDRRDRAAALNLRGWLLDAKGEYEGAFRAFRAANQARPSEFLPADFIATVNRLIRFFSRERLSRLPTSGCQSDRPVFIVGMPRSGSSLMEQVLAAHSRVHACGERTDFYRLPRILSAGAPADRWPMCLEALEPATMAAAARRYLEAEADRPSETRRATDKLPANLLNLGLVQLLFPKARIIYCRRDPMDVGLSCFQQDFLSPGMAFARDLAHIGVYEKGCRLLMSHWRKVLDLPILTVDYESFVSQPEPEARRLVEFLDLEWEDACLLHYRSKRVVRTASHGQVRKPVYGSSVGRWKHYESWLGPLREALDAPWPDPGDAAAR